MYKIIKNIQEKGYKSKIILACFAKFSLPFIIYHVRALDAITKTLGKRL